LLDPEEAAPIERRWRDVERSRRAELDAIDTGAARDPELVRVLSELGTALVFLGDAGEARAHLERALRIDRGGDGVPSTLHGDTLHALARAAMLEGNRRRALELLERERGTRQAAREEDPLALARVLREIDRLGGPGDPAIELELYESAFDDGALVVPPSLESVYADARRDAALRLPVLRAAALHGETVWRHDAALADALRRIADVHHEAGDAEAALLWHERAWVLRPPEPFVRGFDAYRVYPAWSAFALALDASGRWTYGFYSGEKTEQDAVERAFVACRRRLPWDGVLADCRLWAINGDVVWKPSGE
jgi:tetratricopeptide (TPR) repeat protein